MRPLKLVLSAFGPYSGQEVIDFELLGKTGVYLITGVTGAGKTTIFDGVSYALYGEASGEVRKAGMLRSKYALPGTPTFVELTFEYSGKRYVVRRNPEYERPKNRGDGFTTERAYAELIYPDGKVVTGAKECEVTACIKDIMGIDKKQFSQIAMIAQGDFLKLLLAKTRDRMDILRHIFKTEKFEKLQNKLFEENKKNEQLYGSLNQSFYQYVNDILCGEDTDFYNQVVSAKEGGVYPDQIISLVEDVVKFYDGLDGDVNEKILEVEQKIQENQKRLNSIKDYNEKSELLNEDNKKLAQLNQKILELKQNYLTAKNRETEIFTLSSTIGEITAQLSSYDELDNLKEAFNSTKQQIDEKNHILSQLNDLDISFNNSIENINLKLKDLSETNLKKQRLENDKEQKTRIKGEIASLIDDNKVINENKSLLLTAQEDYKKASLKEQEERLRYDSISKEFLDNQAGVLANDLQDNCPCPVCGSLSHPKLATISQTAPTWDDVKLAKKTWEAYHQKMEHFSGQAGKISGALTEKSRSFYKTAEALFGNFKDNLKNDDIEAFLLQEDQKIIDQITQIDLDIKKEQDNITLKNRLESRLTEETKLQEANLEKISKIKVMVASLEANLETTKIQGKKLSQTLKFTGRKSAEQHIQSLQNQKDCISLEIETAQKAYNDAINEISALNGAINQLKTQLSAINLGDIDTETAICNQLATQKAELFTKQKETSHYLETNKNLLKNLKEKSLALSNLSDKLKWLNSLSKTMNGNLVGKDKIMLEAYVQTSYFDRIIRRANRRLMEMTGGQYELIRKKASLQGQGGLDLNVIDHYNGSQREVGTMSGGESFKASLCLALGLSEEIQSSAGGIQLETMFVDEGFGSLDTESLELSMNALIGLGESNRLVGIISHVDLLKERIDKQIVITKDKIGGSHATIKLG